MKTNSRAAILQELRKAVEVYRELGFEYLPLKGAEIEASLSGACSSNKESSHGISRHRSERDDSSAHDKAEALENLRNEIGDCRRCKLWKGRKNIVFGEGSSDASIMFIGEGPGREEDIQARPFVGDAGRLLTNLILKLGLKREAVYIGNMVKCRPPNNRDPEEDEIRTCRPFIEKQIEIIRPGVIVSLGRVSAQALLKTKIPIGKLRGSFSEFCGIPVMPTYHPAYLLRNPRDKWRTWEDMQKVLEKLKESDQL